MRNRCRTGCGTCYRIAQTSSMRNTHKQACINHCKDYLNTRECGQYYNEADFMHIYRKFNGANGNPFYVGMDAADFIMRTAKPKTDERGYKN